VISINYRDPSPIYEQIFESFKNLIISGVLPEGSAMPSVRQLAVELSVNPNTVQQAYKKLTDAGLICSVGGRGSFVSAAEAKELHRLELIREILSIKTKLYALGMSDDEIMNILKEENAND